ncbi:MAG: ATPase [Acidimicrobiia bacterium]|nr:MAG: ATPase [Acidimicrobiia bacterium]
METDQVGRVLGTEDATPLEFWFGVGDDVAVQLDDVVATERRLPGGGSVRIYGVVSQVRARYEGARYDSDVFLIADGVLPAEISEAAQVMATRFEPETFVPPLPGTPVRLAADSEREEALFFDRMEHRLPIGLSRSGEPLYLNLDFLDGRRGAHVNISGVSGVATKTTYATFLLHSLFNSGVLGTRGTNTKALVFNVKGEDLLFLDRPNLHLDDEQRARYELLGLPPRPFRSVRIFAPARPGPSGAPQTAARLEGVSAFFWTLAEFCSEELLPFLFADAEDDRAQYTMVVHNVATQLKRRAVPMDQGGGVRIDGETISTFRDLVGLVSNKVQDEEHRYDWAGPAIGTGTINAFLRRLHSTVRHVERIIRGDVPGAERRTVTPLQGQLTVVDLHGLHDRAKRFVVGVIVRRAFEEREAQGSSEELLFLVLDELNKYAPREGWSPIKEILLDVAERGRSLGVILIGAQQTASEVERRIVSNSSIRVVGRLDTAEAGREEYGFLPGTLRQRATILKPGTMIVSQPELPVPLVVEFPFPAWATRAAEADRYEEGAGDPFDDLY